MSNFLLKAEFDRKSSKLTYPGSKTYFILSVFEERSGGLSGSKTSPTPNLIFTTYSKTQCFQLFPGRNLHST